MMFNYLSSHTDILGVLFVICLALFGISAGADSKLAVVFGFFMLAIIAIFGVLIGGLYGL